jgi:hypothetical protein
MPLSRVNFGENDTFLYVLPKDVQSSGNGRRGRAPISWHVCIEVKGHNFGIPSFPNAPPSKSYFEEQSKQKISTLEEPKPSEPNCTCMIE